jgi:hypothetical protein
MWFIPALESAPEPIADLIESGLRPHLPLFGHANAQMLSTPWAPVTSAGAST